MRKESNMFFTWGEGIPQEVRENVDSFSKELFDLWDKRELAGKTFYVEEDRRVISYVMVEETHIPDMVIIRGFYTVPDKRNLGIGADLLDYIATRYQQIPAIVNITEGAEGLYLRKGFQLAGRRSDFPGEIVAYRGRLTEKAIDYICSRSILI